jgi:hypothetical protein
MSLDDIQLGLQSLKKRTPRTLAKSAVRTPTDFERKIQMRRLALEDSPCKTSSPSARSAHKAAYAKGMLEDLRFSVAFTPKHENDNPPSCNSSYTFN